MVINKRVLVAWHDAGLKLSEKVAFCYREGMVLLYSLMRECLFPPIRELIFGGWELALQDAVT